MHGIYGRQHQPSFARGQRNLHSDLQVVIHVGHTLMQSQLQEHARSPAVFLLSCLSLLSATHCMKF